MKTYGQYITERLEAQREENTKEKLEIRKKEYQEKIKFHRDKAKEYEDKINNLKSESV